MPLVNCPRNAGIAVAVERQCPHYYYTSQNQNITMDIPVIRLTQNEKHLFVASMAAKDILSISSVPSLRWGTENNMDFCTDTHVAVGALPAGTRPTLWQRPLAMDRELKIRNYFYTAGAVARDPESVIPGAVILGELGNDNTYPHTAVVQPTALVGGVQYYNLHLEWTLRDSCPCTWTPPNGDRWFDRCGDHQLMGVDPQWTPCTSGNHEKSTTAFQIIDGQHRTLGIMKAGEDEEVPVVFMLRNKLEVTDQNNVVTSIEVVGTNDVTQAKIFEKVNNSSEALKPAHILWIERLLTPGATLTPDQEKSFDLAAQLGHNPPVRGVPDHGRWKDMITFQPKAVGQVHTDSGAMVKTNGGALTEIIHVLERYETLGYGTPIQQLTHFLNGACDPSPAGIPASAYPMFYGATVKPFRSERMFTGIIRAYEHIAEWAIYLGAGAADCLNHDNFTNAWNLHQMSWSAANRANWSALKKSGEPPAKHRQKMHSLMWPDAPAPFAPAGTTPPTSPTWDTKGICNNWTDYANMGPDPIRLITPGTRKSLDSIWNPRSNDNSNCDGTCGGACTCGGVGTCPNCECAGGANPNNCSGPIIGGLPIAGMFTISWEGPRNVLDESVQILIREYDPVSGEYLTPIDPIEMMIDLAATAAAGGGRAVVSAAKNAARAAAYSVTNYTHTLAFDLVGRGLTVRTPLRVEITDVNMHGSSECILEFELF